MFCISSILGRHVDTNESEDPNLFVFITHLTPPSGGGTFTVGIAWGGTVCIPDNANINGGSNNGKGFRISINSWVSSDLGLSEVKKTYGMLFIGHMSNYETSTDYCS